ncbi:UNVERIFIED_ORG: putative GTPase [Paraburkholderia sediminicola]|uniref:dynamin family protein n=1 Tax=Paraburkholderia sp. GAS82 TaxID=3035137 RepID=UPI002111C1C5|nr:putative GTPase [Paraburkholderia sediminicola]
MKSKTLPIDRLKRLHDLVDAPGGVARQALDTPLQRIQCILGSVLIQQLIVPVVGSFSPGKSSLINTVTGDNLLPVAIAPETALPAELRFADIRE